MTADVDRVWSKVEVGHPLGCWEWRAHVRSDGYGQMWWDGSQWLAHRLTYALLLGPIPDGLVTDHLCRNRSCVNPDHLEAVTQSVNVRRGASGLVSGARQRSKTHCPSGHEYNDQNTYRSKKGQRFCRTCARIRARERRAA